MQIKEKLIMTFSDAAGTLEQVGEKETARRHCGSCIPEIWLQLPPRRESYQRYIAMPHYPALIIGPFDTFEWAADPNRRADFYDARQKEVVAIPAVIKGFAGSAGCVEGTVRRIGRIEDRNQLQLIEILVTTITNIGWTPLFPRLAAIVTDVGAPLSHAAILSHEMGITSVVGCGNANMC